MPNHCDQQVYIHGPQPLVDRIHQHLTCKRPEFCQVIVPMPFEHWGASEVVSTGKGLTSIPVWYDWRVDNWGTKWDVCDIEITSDIEFSKDPDTAWFTFNCWTAWGPPIPVWQKLHDMGVSVDADYQDEGDMFMGQWLNGEDTCWVPEFKEEA